MKKLIAFVLFVNAVLLVGRFWSDLTAAAQGGGVANDPEPCRVDPTLWSIDANDDDEVDISDPVYLLNWLFNGGPEPQVCLAEKTPGLTPRQLELLEALEFGSRIAGTWALGAPGGAPGGVITINADGTAASNDANDFSGGESPGFHSAVRWSWRQMDGRRVEVVGLFGVFPTDGTDPFIVRLRAELEFSPDYQTFSGNVCEHDFPLDQDPLDPAAVSDAQRTYPAFARRLPFLAQVCEQ